VKSGPFFLAPAICGYFLIYTRTPGWHAAVFAQRDEILWSIPRPHATFPPPCRRTLFTFFCCHIDLWPKSLTPFMARTRVCWFLLTPESRQQQLPLSSGNFLLPRWFVLVSLFSYFWGDVDGSRTRNSCQQPAEGGKLFAQPANKQQAAGKMQKKRKWKTKNVKYRKTYSKKRVSSKVWDYYQYQMGF